MGIRYVRGFDIQVGMRVRRIAEFLPVVTITPIDDLEARRLYHDTGDTTSVTRDTVLEVLDDTEPHAVECEPLEPVVVGGAQA